jgi:hypothetical protein
MKTELNNTVITFIDFYCMCGWEVFGETTMICLQTRDYKMAPMGVGLVEGTTHE